MAGPESSESAPAPAAAPVAAGRSRERAFRLVLAGLVVGVIGFTAILVANSAYPCAPAAGSTTQPPLADCATYLSPWVGLTIVGLVLAVIGYLRVGR